MNQRNRLITTALYLSVALSGFNGAVAQKYEAESVPRTSQAAIIACAECSGGQAVDMKDGDLNFTIDIPSAGYYKIDLFCSSPNGDDKQQKVRLDKGARDSP